MKTLGERHGGKAGRRSWAWVWAAIGLLAVGAGLLGAGGGKGKAPAAQVKSAPDDDPDGMAAFDAKLYRESIRSIMAHAKEAASRPPAQMYLQYDEKTGKSRWVHPPTGR
jgi:hypothetical protein